MSEKNFMSEKKKSIISFIVMILFVVLAAASSSAEKISEDSAYDFGYGVGRVLDDLSN